MKQDPSTTPAKPAMPAMQDTTPLALSTSVPWQGKRIVRAWSWFMAVAVLVVLGFVLVWPDSSASIAQPAVGRQPDPFVAATKALRPSVVAVGSYVRTDNPTVKYFGTGFVIDDGLTVVTNAHVVAALRQAQRLDQLRIYFPDSRDVDGREAKVLIEDAFHDVALIQFAGRPAPTVNLAPALDPEQGISVGILGYPTGTMLGLVPAVHQGVVGAIVPAVLPLPSGVKMTPELMAALKNPYNLYQLDMVAFPGNSGSPLFDSSDGTVIGIINMTLATKTREHLFDKPTGIAYAVPVRWIHELLRRYKAAAGIGR